MYRRGSEVPKFRFKVTGADKPLAKIKYTQPVPVKEPETPIGKIQGITPDSKEEWWVAVALWRLGWQNRFIFQYEVFGGRQVRGGQLIDFLVLTRPRPTPLYINASYFHGNETEEHFKVMRVYTEMKGRWNMPIIWWANELQNEQVTYNKVGNTFGVG